MSEHSKSKGEQPKGKHVVPKKFTMPKSFIQGSKPKPEKLSDKEKITHQSKYFIRKAKKETPFYKTGPSLLEGGGIGVTEENTQSVSATKANNILLGRTTPSTIGKDYSNFGKNLTSAETPKIDTEAGIATGKGSGKINRAKRKQKKDKMKAEGKSKADIRQTKAKSKRLETKAKMESLQKSGDKSQATKNKIARLDAKRGRLKKREARIEGRKAKKRETAKYLKNN